MAWIKERPNAYPENFLPPHTDQFYATDIPMYYDDQHRFNIDRALSKEDILKQSSSYPYLDTSKVTFADLSEGKGAHYDPNIDQSVLNLKYVNPQNIDETALKYIDHETIHRTLNPKHGIPAASQLLKGSIEPYNQYSWEQEGPKRATDYNPSYNRPEDRLKSEHLLIKAIQNLDNPEFDISKLDQSLYQGFLINNYHDALLDQVSEGLYSGYEQDPYYKPKWAEGFNAPGEVRRGYFGLRDLFDRSALKYKNILKNYGPRGLSGRVAGRRSPKKTYVAPPRGGGADVMPTPPPKRTYVPPARPHGNGGGRRPDKPGGFTDPGKGSYGPHKADGGLINFYRYGGFIG